ncbi:Abi family protein [Clostridium botulinum]|nr:Abi family protein [Clostridium botulinum]
MLFYRGYIVVDEKPFRSYNDQLNILKSRGMKVYSDETVMRILQKENYYNVINGYKDLFLATKQTETTEERYKSGTYFSEVYGVYKFDCELKSIFLKRILRIENNIKTAIAYNFSYKYREKNNLVIDNFDLKPMGRESKENRYCNVMGLITRIQGEIGRQIKCHSSIKHYMLEYGYVPLWVTMNVLTFGTVSLFYKYMKQSDKQLIAKEYKTSEIELTLILKVLSLVRNLCAHDERLYNFKTKDSIRNNWVHEKLMLPKGESGYLYGRNDLYAILICIRLLMDKEETNEIISEINTELKVLEKELKVIKIDSILSAMGFPKDWYKLQEI